MRFHHTLPFGAEATSDGVRFALFAPSAESVDLMIADRAPQKMVRLEDGMFSLTDADAHAGSRYRFRIDGTLIVPDPASRFQPNGIDADGCVIDSNSYEWKTPWTGRPWPESVIYEAHVGTVTPDGTYAAFAEKLPALAQVGITAIELMPIADCPGARNWGYDGVLPFAPNPAYGTPDDLRAFIDRAHALNIMVLLDVVYNHFGPSGNYLHAYAKSFFTDRHMTPWGAAINFDDKGCEPVRTFFVQNALYWIGEFQVDGLRFDAVHEIKDDSSPHILAEIASAIRRTASGRHIHLILENEHNAARWLARENDGRPRFYTAQWNDDIHHCLHTLITGETDAYYADFADAPLDRLGRCLAEGFAYQGEKSGNLGHARGEASAHLPPTAFVSFFQNHDQIGNRAFGERISTLTTPGTLAFAHEVLLLSPQIPMLFMGEEWSASAPFLFFVDFASDPALSKAVREGRRKEFARFPAFADPGAEERIPDPTAASTFECSRLDWNERNGGAHRQTLAQIGELLQKRRDGVVPLLATPFEGAAFEVKDQVLNVEWRFAGGWLRLRANAGSSDCAWDEAKEWRILHTSGQPSGTAIRMPQWTCVFAQRAAHEG